MQVQQFSTPTPFQLMVERLFHTRNSSYSRPHAFRYGNQKKSALLLRLERTNSDLVCDIMIHPVEKMGAFR